MRLNKSLEHSNVPTGSRSDSISNASASPGCGFFGQAVHGGIAEPVIVELGTEHLAGLAGRNVFIYLLERLARFVGIRERQALAGGQLRQTQS